MYRNPPGVQTKVHVPIAPCVMYSLVNISTYPALYVDGPVIEQTNVVSRTGLKVGSLIAKQFVAHTAAENNID